MVHQKIRQTTFIRLLVFTFIAGISTFSTGVAQQWETITSLKNVRRMTMLHDTLYVATSGGLLAIADPHAAGRVYDNLNGLGTTDITDLVEDAFGQKWVTGFGRLIRFSPAQSKQYLFEKDNAFLSLTCVEDDGDYLWIGTDSGLVWFSKYIDDGQIQDSYTRFGDLAANPIVRDILLYDDTIWIATSAGLAVADRTDPMLLKSPSAWTTFNRTSYPELGTNDMLRIVKYEGTFYVATAQGLFRLEISDTDTTFTLGARGYLAPFTDLKVENDTLFFFFAWGRGYVKDSAYVFLDNDSLPHSITTGCNTGAFRWVGTAGAGIYHDADSVGNYIEYPYTGPPGNNVSDLVVDQAGTLTGGFTEKLAAQLNDEVWLSLGFDGWTTEIILDSSQQPWVGTWGNGVWLVKNDTVINYDETNSTLRGIPVNDKFVVVRGLATDGRFLFAGCYLALNGYPVAIGDMSRLDDPVGWDSLGFDDGLTNEYIVSLDYMNGNLAVGTEAAGVYTCYLGDDPFDHATRSCIHYTTANGLNSNVIRVVKYAPSGDLWVGTNFGLCRWDLDRFTEVILPEGIGPDITALEFDERGNIWIGSTNGLAHIDGATGTATVYHARTDGVVSDDIRNLYLHPTTGDLYIATSAGISVLYSGATYLTPLVENVLAYPNPYVIRSDNDVLRFNFARSGTVSIFSLAGELVAEFPVTSPWDGNNQRGMAVASGVYTFVITDADGNVGRGKFLLVREE